jgi:ribose 5-phosphate isomerase A
MKRGRDRAKQRAGESAAAEVESGMVVGLGTGSTAAAAIRRLGERVEAGLDIEGVPTSHQSRALAREVGIPLTSLAAATPDVAIDGADQVADGDLVKGGGGAHAREKVVDSAADRLVVVVDAQKESNVLDHHVPVSVLPAAEPTVTAAIAERGGEPTLRAAEQKDGPVVTDNGNLILDCAFGGIDEPASLAADLDAVPGVVAHGLFVGLADVVHVGHTDDVDVRRP